MQKDEETAAGLLDDPSPESDGPMSDVIMVSRPGTAAKRKPAGDDQRDKGKGKGRGKPVVEIEPEPVDMKKHKPNPPDEQKVSKCSTVIIII